MQTAPDPLVTTESPRATAVSSVPRRHRALLPVVALVAAVGILASQALPTFALTQSPSSNAGAVSFAPQQINGEVTGTSLYNEQAWLQMPTFTVHASPAYKGSQKITITDEAFFAAQGTWTERPLGTSTGTAPSGSAVQAASWWAPVPLVSLVNVAAVVTWQTPSGALIASETIEFNNAADYRCVNTMPECSIYNSNGFGTIYLNY